MFLFSGHKNVPSRQTQHGPPLELELELLELEEVRKPQVIDGSSPLHIPFLQQEIVFPPVPRHCTESPEQTAFLPGGQNTTPPTHLQQPLELELLELDVAVIVKQLESGTPRSLPQMPPGVQHSANVPVQIIIFDGGLH